MPRTTRTKTERPHPAPYPPTADQHDPLEFLSVELDTEDIENERIYDDAVEVRRKIRAFFRDPRYAGVTQKRFLEAIGGISSGSFQRFINKKKGGEDNSTYPGA